MKLPIHWRVPPLIVLACLLVLAVAVCNFFGLLTVQFPERPAHLPRSAEVCEARVSRMMDERLRGSRLWLSDLFCRDGDVMRPVPGVAQVTVMRDSTVRPACPPQAEAVEGPLYGDHIRFRSHLRTPHGYHNPGAIDWERKSAADGVDWTGAVQDAGWVIQVRSGRWSPLRAIDAWRQRLSRQMATIEDPELRGSAAALILGSAGLLPEKFGDGLRYLGIIHLYVISGLHVAVVAWAVYEMIYWLLARRSRWALRHPLWRWAAVASLAAVWTYVGLVGGGVAVVRAGIMVSAYLAALILDRHPHVGAAIALAAIILLLQSPHVLFLPGFQLSFVAVIALVWIYPRLAERWRVTEIRRRWQRWITEGLLATLVATWATVPIVAWHFHQTPLLGIPANIIAGPYTTIILMPLGFLWTIFAAVPGLAEGLQQIWVWAATPLVAAIDWAAPLAESTQWTFTPTVWEVVWWYAVIIPPLCKGRSPAKREGGVEQVCSTSPGPSLQRRGVAIWSLLGLTLFSLRLYDHYRPHPLQLTFLDVGQGAAVLVEFPNRRTMLIDAGGAPGSDFDIGRWVVAPALLARGITRVDELLLTHPHPDHYGGLAYIAEHFHPAAFWTNGSTGEEGDMQWQAFAERMQGAGMSAQILHRGQQRREGDVEVIWHHPPESGPDESLGKNNGSLVTEIRQGEFRALIVGDIHKETEAQILQTSELGPVDVLQVPHHASRTSSTAAFLQRMDPQVAVAQLGFENRYGFPHPEVERRYKELEIPLCRTDRDGAVTIRVKPNAGFPTRQFSIQTGRSADTCSARARSIHRGD